VGQVGRDLGSVGGARERLLESRQRRRVFQSRNVSNVDGHEEEYIPVRCRGPPCLIARTARSLPRDLGKYPRGIGSSLLDHRNSNSDNHSACSTARPSFEAIADSFSNQQFDFLSS
jgi:hypothetical protein